ncbi:MAG: four helix bundle protein [Saprospiraceae bacterium]
MTNEEFNEHFRKRTMEFALAVLRFIETVPLTPATRVMVYQMAKAGTSVGANYRASCRSRSKNERIAKICIVVEEADETQYWLELFDKTSYRDRNQLKLLIIECGEILKVMTSLKESLYPK